MSVINPNAFTTRPEIEGTFGVVTSTHWIATAVGMAILEKGGNAFDAAVATAFTLQVVEPHLNGPGGDVPVIVYDTRRGKPEVICGQGPAPAGATIAHYRGLGPRSRARHRAACRLRARHIRDLDAAAARLRHRLVARSFVARHRLTHRMAIRWWSAPTPPSPLSRSSFAIIGRRRRRCFCRMVRSRLPERCSPTARLPLPTNAFSTEAERAGGDRVAQIEAARKSWSQGFVAEAVDRFCRTQDVFDSSGARHRGVLTGDDMARWAPRVEAPLTYDYGRYTVCKTGPWGQGPVMLQQLALLKGFDLDGLDPAGADFIHLQVECAKLAYADREEFYGDPDFVEVPMARLLSDAYNVERRKLVDNSASLEMRPGSIPGFGGKGSARLRQRTDFAAAAGAGEPTVGELADAGDTVHFDIIDQAGNMVSATPSGGWLQSSPVIPELGFPLGTRAQMFWLDEGHPAALAPGKRPRTTLTPTLALRDGEPYLGWGTPGGDQQDQWITQFFLRHVHAGMNLQEAIDAPAWHSEHFPSSFWPRAARPGVLVLEGRIAKDTTAELRRRGHIVEVGAEWSEGRLTAASRDGRKRRAAANPRGMQGYAAGR